MDLYTAWPAFNFKDPAYGPNSFNLTGMNPNPGTVGVIDRHYKVWPHTPIIWTQHPPSLGLTQTVGCATLGAFMADMVLGVPGGSGTDATPSTGTDWSRLVDLLLKVTFNRTFRHTPTLGPRTEPRGVLAFALPDSGQPLGGVIGRLLSDGEPPFAGVEIIEDGRSEGISIMRIELKRRPDAPAQGG
ncbi:hypothetical protein ACFQX4_23755 [Roseomonas sp. GCM10028921]